MKFVDLFAGLGGFHLALKRLGHTCVFACEIDKGLQNLYQKNFDIFPSADIRSIVIEDIPSHDIFCAGFPCQPFSKAGAQEGFAHPTSGDLFKYVLRILEYHRPKYIMLENVPNLKMHDNGRTWGKMGADLESLGYAILDKRLSPHIFGIPQIRERMFIVGSQVGLSGFTWPEPTPKISPSIMSALDTNPADARKLSPNIERCLEVWQKFLDDFPKDEEFPSFPIWSMEFGATYPFEDTTPYALGVEGLKSYKGSHGRNLASLSEKDIMLALPSHARVEEVRFPKWKIQFIRQNRVLYQKHRQWIDEWMPQILEFSSSLQKLEWNCKGEERCLWKFVIQLRASGVRVKRPTTSPSLISATTRQVPIIAWEKRHITPREAVRLQSMEQLEYLPPTGEQAFKALGNAVNVDLVEMVAKALLSDKNQVDVPVDELQSAKQEKLIIV